MVSSRQRVRFEGMLRGEGREATCVVAATAVSLPGGPTAFCEYSVESVSTQLPPGRYELLARGETNRLRYDGRSWLADVF